MSIKSWWLDWAEGAVLIIATSFLLFPTLNSLLTVTALIVLPCIWLARSRQRPIFPYTPLNGALLLWCIMLGIGILVTALPDLTLPKATVLFLGIAVWRYLVSFTNTVSRLRWALLGFAFLGLGMAVLGFLTTNWPSKIPFLQTVLNYLPAQFFNLPEAPTSGVHANQLGGTLVLYFPFTLSLFIGYRPKKHTRWWFVVSSLFIVGLGGVLVLTQSRSAWLGTFVSCIIILGLWGSMPIERLKRRWYWGLVVGLVTLSLIALLSMGPERLQSLVQEPSGMTALGSLNTLGFRFEVWRWAWSAIQDFPFTGCGLGTFRQVVRLLYPLNVDPGYDIAHAHNIFLQVALDVGLPGLMAYLALLGLAIQSAWRLAWQSAPWRPLSLGLLSGILALHIYGLTDALALGSKPNLIFWYAIGLICVLVRMWEQERKFKPCS